MCICVCSILCTFAHCRGENAKGKRTRGLVACRLSDGAAADSIVLTVFCVRFNALAHHIHYSYDFARARARD